VSDTWKIIVLSLRTTIPEGNVVNPSTKKTQIPTIDSPQADPGKNSKTVYFNDSFELDEIPLDTISIIDLNNNDDS
jgi:hypothetical protein